MIHLSLIHIKAVPLFKCCFRQNVVQTVFAIAINFNSTVFEATQVLLKKTAKQSVLKALMKVVYSLLSVL